MKFISCKYFSLLALLCLFASSAQAERYIDEPGVECRTRCNSYECGCNPLYCGALDFQIHGGVLPISWHDRGQFSIIQCTGTPATNPISALFDIPKFSKFFKLPWTVGFQFGYALSDNVRVYFEFDYSQAKGKNAVSLDNGAPSPFPGIPQITVLFNPGKYKLYDMYVGGRYYFDRWCEKLSFFLGVKAGFVHHNRVKYSSTIRRQEADEIPAVFVTFTDNVDLLKRNTVPSGGFDFGFDLCYCGNWSFVLTGGVLASCGPKSNSITFGQPAGCGQTTPQPDLPAGINNLLVGNIGAELRFPITLAARYSF